MTKPFYINPSMDLETLTWSHEAIVHEDHWVELKGDPVAQEQERAQANFDNTLTSIFSQQFAKQAQTLDYLKGKMQPIIDAGGIGYSPENLAAMRTQATDQLSSQYNNAQQAAQQREFTTGNSRTLPSGVNDQINASIFAQEAADKASTQNTITLNDQNLKQQNYWNAFNALNGVQASYNPLGYANAATSGSNAVSGLSQANTAASGPTIGSILGGVAGGALAGAGTAGGFGKLFGVCWIAAKIFGSWLDPRVLQVRDFLLGDFSKTWYGRYMVALYKKHGEWASNQPLLVAALKPLFYLALDQARS